MTYYLSKKQARTVQYHICKNLDVSRQLGLPVTCSELFQEEGGAGGPSRRPGENLKVLYLGERGMCGYTAQLIPKILGNVIHLVDDLERGTMWMCGQRGPKAQEMVSGSEIEVSEAQASRAGLGTPERLQRPLTTATGVSVPRCMPSARLGSMQWENCSH